MRSELKIEFPRTFHFIKPSSLGCHFIFPSPFPFLPRFLLSLSTSGKAYYLHGSLIDYKRSILFPRNMAVKRSEYTFRVAAIHDEHRERWKKQSGNFSLFPFIRWKTLSLSLCLSFPSFLSSSFFPLVHRFLLPSSSRLLFSSYPSRSSFVPGNTCWILAGAK